MSPGRSLLREEIRDTLAEAMFTRTRAKYQRNGLHYNPSWMESMEMRNAATDLAAALWVKFFEPSEDERTA
jgi:hypothetical protein